MQNGQFARQSGHRALILVPLFSAFVGLPAYAGPAAKVYLPQVEYQELELELRGGYQDSDGDPGDNTQQYVFDVGYGLTPFWFSEIAFEYGRESGVDGGLNTIE